jgi:uncharacterized RDD family membrane protein YckC
MQSRGGDLASYASRVGAALLDGLVLALVVAAVLEITGKPVSESRGLIVIATIVSSLIYAPPLLRRRGPHNGQTLGKQALKIRAVRADAQPMGWGTALLREFVGKGALGLVPFFSIVDYLFPLADLRRQAIHDKIASTFVVRADAVPDLEPAPDAAPEESRHGLSEDPFGGGR